MEAWQGLAGVLAFLAVCGAAMALLLVGIVWGLRRTFQERAIYREFGKRRGLAYDHISARYTGALESGDRRGTFTCQVGHPPLDEGEDSSFRRITWTAYVAGLDAQNDRFSLEPRQMPQPLSKSPLSDFGLGEARPPRPTGFDQLDRAFVFRCGTEALAARLLTPEFAAAAGGQTRLRAGAVGGRLTVEMIDIPVPDHRHLPAAEIETVLKVGALLAKQLGPGAGGR